MTGGCVDVAVVAGDRFRLTKGRVLVLHLLEVLRGGCPGIRSPIAATSERGAQRVECEDCASAEGFSSLNIIASSPLHCVSTQILFFRHLVESKPAHAT